MKIRPPAERKERRGGIYISLDAKIFALYRDHDGGGENFKKGRRSAKIQRPCREHTVWNISRALAYWDASGVKLYLAQVVSLRLGNPRVSSRGVTPSVCQFESFANRVRWKIVLSSYLWIMNDTCVNIMSGNIFACTPLSCAYPSSLTFRTFNSRMYVFSRCVVFVTHSSLWTSCNIEKKFLGKIIYIIL